MSHCAALSLGHYAALSTHQIYIGTVTNYVLDGIFSVHIENAKRVGGMSSASPAAVAFPNDAEVVLCYRGHTYKQLFVQLFDANYHSIIRQTHLGVESDYERTITVTIMKYIAPV